VCFHWARPRTSAPPSLPLSLFFFPSSRFHISPQDEVLAAAKAAGTSDWRILLLDSTTTPLVSAATRVSDTLDAGISLIEDVGRKREAAPGQEAVYFIAPGPASVARLVEDWAGKPPGSPPPYAGAHIFFSATPSAGDLAAIKGCAPLLARLRTLADAGLAFLAVDPRAAVTAPATPLAPLYGPAGPDGDPPGQRAALGEVAASLATLVTSLGAGLPTIRFRAPLPPAAAAAAAAAGAPPPHIDARALLPQRLALELHGRLQAAAASGVLPGGGGGAGGWELIIIPRAWDALAPLAHDWCYGPLAADVGALGGPRAGPPTFTHSPDTGGGPGGAGGGRAAGSVVEHVLDPRTDPLWAGLRGRHFAAAAADLARRLDEFRAKNSAAAFASPNGGNNSNGGGAAGAGAAAAASAAPTAAAPLDSRSLKALVSALPQYRAQLALLGAHTALAARVGAAVDAGGLVEVGRLEEGLAFGEATSKELIAFLAGPPAPAPAPAGAGGGGRAAAPGAPAPAAAPPEARLRLLLLYAATHPGKLDAVKEAQWSKLARLPTGGLGGGPPAPASPAAYDFSRALTGLEALGVPVRKGGGGGAGGGKGPAGGGGGGLAAAAAAALGFGPRKSGRRAAPPPGVDPAAARAGEEDGGLILGRLQPAVGDLFVDAAAGRLGADEFPAVAPPDESAGGGGRGSGAWGGGGGGDGGGSGAIGRAGSVRSVHSAAGWARRARGAGGEDAPPSSFQPATSTRPILVFVVGGITPGEARAAAVASARTGRDCFIAGTGWDTPATFLSGLRELGGLDYSHED